MTDQPPRSGPPSLRLVALVILGALALCSLLATTWLLTSGVDAEAALAVLALGTGAGGAVAGALTLGRTE